MGGSAGVSFFLLNGSSTNTDWKEQNSLEWEGPGESLSRVWPLLTLGPFWWSGSQPARPSNGSLGFSMWLKSAKPAEALLLLLKELLPNGSSGTSTSGPGASTTIRDPRGPA